MEKSVKQIVQKTKQHDALFVEDEIFVLTTTRYLLENFFNKVDTAMNGRQGLEKFKAKIAAGEKYGLVVADIFMPIMDGYEMCVEILKLVPHQKTMIITGHASSMYQQKFKDLGVDIFLMKPVSYKRLCEEIDACCGEL